MEYTAEQLATIIKMACKKDVVELGEDDDQNFYIFEWMNMFMFQNAKKIRKTQTSDLLAISSNGYVDFLVSSQPIVNMYEPYLLLDASEKQYGRRTSYDSPQPGWYREDAYSDIHVRGLNGTYKLKYIRYPTKITLGDQTPELPPAMYGELISWVSSRIKYSKNYVDESKAMQDDAQALRLAGVKAAMSGMGTNAQLPGLDDANLGG